MFRPLAHLNFTNYRININLTWRTILDGKLVKIQNVNLNIEKKLILLSIGLSNETLNFLNCQKIAIMPIFALEEIMIFSCVFFKESKIAEMYRLSVCGSYGSEAFLLLCV